MGVLDGYDASPPRTIITPASFDKLLAPLAIDPIPPISSTAFRTLPPIDHLVLADKRRSPPHVVKTEPFDRLDYPSTSYPRPILPPLGQPSRSTSATSASSVISSSFSTYERPNLQSHSSSGLSAASVSAGIHPHSRSSSPYSRDKSTTLAPLPFSRPPTAPFAFGAAPPYPYTREDPRRLPALLSPANTDHRLHPHNHPHPYPPHLVDMRNGATASDAEARTTRSTRKRKEPEDRDDEDTVRDALASQQGDANVPVPAAAAELGEPAKNEAEGSGAKGDLGDALAAERENGQSEPIWADKSQVNAQAYDPVSNGNDRAGPSTFNDAFNANFAHDLNRGAYEAGGGYTLANAETPGNHHRRHESELSDDGQSRTPSHGNVTSAAVSSFIANLPPDTRNALESGSQPYSRSPELRVSHKLAERKRRKEMKDLFDELRDHLPADRGMKASKWEILSRAVDFITQIKRVNTEMAREIEGLRREVDGLKAAAYAGNAGTNYTDAANGAAPAAGYPGGSGYGGPTTYPPPGTSTSYATGVHASLPQSNTRGGSST